jgi:hypothetical protein
MPPKTSNKSSNLAKAKLTSKDPVEDINFMFNPSELSFNGIVETAENSGARTQSKGQPKVSFSHTKAYKITITKIIYDTYESGEDVVGKYIEPLKKALEFVSGLERPPIYSFIWGKTEYLRRCFVEKLDYKLTMFLPNGTPVRAVIDSLTLKEADEEQQNAPVAAQSPSAATRQTDTPANRQGANNQANRGKGNQNKGSQTKSSPKKSSPKKGSKKR